MMPKAAPVAETRDVTSKFKDVNDYDRIYETGRGYLVKVRVTAHPVTSTSLTFDITGSWAGDDGKARRFADDRPFIVQPDQYTLAPDSPVDLRAELEDARRRMVVRVDQVAANYYAAAALTNVRRTDAAEL
ncbi:hypothetical protein [Brevundimonas sp.]|uniref:hypothetical protein n=1 Tax=Brevundimonas sp. TaxID=1871086 RepID=UPI002FC7C539